MLWTQTVSYAPPSVEKFMLKSAPSTVKSINSVSMDVNKSTVAKAGLSISIDPSEELKSLIRSGWSDAISLLEIETGRIVHSGRATIKVYVNNQYIGRIKIMDGDPSTTSFSASHTFVMTLGDMGNMIKALSTTNKFDLTFYAYGLDAELLIRKLKFSVLKTS
jgi:hypothetical protein